MDVQALSERTTMGVFLRQAEKLGDRVLLRYWRDDAWQELTWTEMRRQALAIAARLVQMGVKPGDRVILMSENRIEWLIADNGIQLAAAVTVPVYPSTVAKTAQQIVSNSEAVLALAGSAEIAERLPRGGSLKETVRLDHEVAEWTRGAPSESDLKEIESRLRAVQPDDIASIIYTSGTTGEPKGVVLAHRNFVDKAKSGLQAFEVGEDDVEVSFLPYSHVFERCDGIFVGMMAGGSAYLARGTDRLVEDIREVRPTIVLSVPRMYEKMYQAVTQKVHEQSAYRRWVFTWGMGVGRRAADGGARHGLRYALAERLVLKPLREQLTGGRLRFFLSGGAPLAAEVEQFFWAAGIKILQGWGMTETTSGATSNTEAEHRYGTVGRALPGYDLKIAEDGEIMVKGPGVMLGYFRNEEATEEVLSDGWLHTGDVGELDGDGFLKITDRKKDLIKTAGGKYVAPQPLEAQLQEQAIIERAVVIGDERPYCVALIVPDWQAVKSQLRLSGSPEELVENEQLRSQVQKLVDQVNQGLGSWESVKYFKLLPEDFSEANGEITPTLKVKRKAVQERHAEEIEELYREGAQHKPAGRSH
ncbi:MAG TPA: AMP-dependent synthetase/ligase [Candidatus Dormibacteraeota bacterium]